MDFTSGTTWFATKEGYTKTVMVFPSVGERIRSKPKRAVRRSKRAGGRLIGDQIVRDVCTIGLYAPSRAPLLLKTVKVL